MLICKCVNQSYKVDLICISDTESISQKTYVPELNLKCLAWIYQYIRMDIQQSILSKDLTKKDSSRDKVCSLFPVELLPAIVW